MFSIIGSVCIFLGLSLYILPLIGVKVAFISNILGEFHLDESRGGLYLLVGGFALIAFDLIISFLRYHPLRAFAASHKAASDLDGMEDLDREDMPPLAKTATEDDTYANAASLHVQSRQKQADIFRSAVRPEKCPHCGKLFNPGLACVNCGYSVTPQAADKSGSDK